MRCDPQRNRKCGTPFHHHRAEHPRNSRKKAEHPFLFAVYEGITKEDVKAYLAGEHDGYRKIITTPEGFDKKVLPAMHELEIPVYKDYFLLFDECEKAIQDVGYRGDIYLPVEDFFKFETRRWFRQRPSFRPTRVSRKTGLRY